MARIRIACDLATEALGLLKSIHSEDVEIISQKSLREQDLKGVSALIIRSGNPIDQNILNAASDLKLIVTATAGFNHIDLQAAKSKGVVCLHCPQSHIESTAQLAMTHILNCTRGIFAADRQVRNGSWRTGQARPDELRDLQLGIVGFGRIGKRVSQMASVFGMKIVAFDPYTSTQDFEDFQVTPMSFIEVLKTSDVTTFHLPLTNETRGMINTKTLAHAQQGSYLVNTSRGGIIKESELIKALRSGQLAGAALDVFENEPLRSDSTLLTLQNVCLSPHIGAYTRGAFERASMEAARKVLGFFDNGAISDGLPPQTDWAKHL